MPDREAMIVYIEGILHDHEDLEIARIRTDRLTDILALLKEQEPVPAIEEWAWYDCYKCGACDKLWGKKTEIERWNFCPWCGRKVKWDVEHSSQPSE